MPTIRTPTAKGAALNTSETEAIIKSPSVAKSSNYNLTAAHNREIHELADGITATLPTASGSLTETDDWFVTLKAMGATGATIDLNGQNVDGVGTDITLAQYETVTLAMNSGASAFHKVNEGSSAWITPTFSAGDFTATGSMTWTVAAGDVTTYAYTKIGKILTISFDIITSTVGGTLSSVLRIAIPGGYVATKEMTTAVFISDNGSRSIGFAQVTAAGTQILIVKTDSSNYSASTDNTQVRGQITIEVD